MTNELIAKETSNNINPVPEGVHIAVCYSVVDVGTQYSEKYDKASRKFIVTWEMPACRIDVDRGGKKVSLPRAISKRYTLSLADKAILRKDLEAWRGRAFTAQELKGFDVKQLVGAACQLQVIHTNNDSKTYANVGAIMALPNGVKAPKPENETTFFTLASLDQALRLPANMPEWQQNMIKESREWEKMSFKVSQNTPKESPAPANAAVAETSATDNDVPF
jgi:hypothetical protein